MHSDVKLLNIVRIQQLTTSTMKLIDMDAIAKLDGSGFMGAKFSSGVLPPEMFEVLDGNGVDKFTTYWNSEYSQRTELWRKIEPRWSASGDAIVVKTWCVHTIVMNASNASENKCCLVHPQARRSVGQYRRGRSLAASFR